MRNNLSLLTFNRRFVTFAGSFLILAATARAADPAAPAPALPPAPGETAPSSILPGRPDEPAAPAAPETPSTVLSDRPGITAGDGAGPLYESQAAGIALHAPAGMKAVGRVDPEHLAQWVDENRDWVFKLSRVALDQPRPLVSLPNAQLKDQGMVDITVANLERDIPGCVVLRQDVTNVSLGEHAAADALPFQKQQPNVGIVAVRYTAEAHRRLTQQALIHANDQLYYVLTLTTPGNEAKDSSAPEDPRERAAVDAMQKMLDTVHLLDRGKVRQDQDARLFRTRSFYVNLSPNKLRAALIPEQWFRVLQHGKDVGYTYVVEQQAAGLPKAQGGAAARAQENLGQVMAAPRVLPGEDILIGIRSRITLNGQRPDKSRGPIQTDSESWMFVTADRKHEDWSRLIVQDDFKSPKKQFSEELGSMDEHLVGLKQGASLSVSQNANAVNLPPIEQQVPPFYLPQAMGHLLPRLLNPKEARTYAFASFVGETRAVMMRYVDVGAPQRVNIEGKLVTVIPISDRLGWEGAATVHYLEAEPGPEGRHKYLGSENRDADIKVLVSDAETIQKIWANSPVPAPRPATSAPKPNAGADAAPTVGHP